MSQSARDAMPQPGSMCSTPCLQPAHPVASSHYNADVTVCGETGVQRSHANSGSHGHEVHPSGQPSACGRTLAPADASHAEPHARSGQVSLIAATAGHGIHIHSLLSMKHQLACCSKERIALRDDLLPDE